jgi:hypothetical protein
MRPVDEAEDTLRVLTTDLLATRETIPIDISNRHRVAKTHARSSIGLRSVNFRCDRRLLCAMFLFAIS